MKATAATANGRQRETILAFILALLTMGGLLLIAGTIVLTDMSEFTRQVESLFQINLDKPEPFDRPPVYAQASAETLEKQVRDGDGKTLFTTTAGNDAPSSIDPGEFVPAPAPQPRPATPTRIPSPNDPRFQQAEQHAGKSVSPTAVPVITRRTINPAARDRVPVLRAVSGTQGGGAGGHPGRTLLAFKPLPMPTAPTPRDTGGVGGELTRFALPESIGEMTRRLVSERPPMGYPTLDKDIIAEFSVYQPVGDAAAYFRLRLRLKPASTLPTLAKDVLFLIDISQSISRKELGKVRAAVLDTIPTLGTLDRFNVILFGESTHSLHPEQDFVPAKSFDRARVSEFIKRRTRERRTDVFNAARVILSRIPASPRPCNVFLISDGKATQGTDEVSRIVHGFRRNNRDNFAIFTFNGGPGGDHYLLRLLSYRSRGSLLNAPNTEKIRAQLTAFIHTYHQPVLANVVASYTNLRLREVYPDVMPNLYRDHPITIWGRTIPGQDVAVRVAGLGAGGPREFFFRTRVPPGDRKHPEILREWARGKAHALITQLADTPRDENLKQQIRTLAQEHKLSDVREVVGGGGWKLRMPWK